jgi:hypothetical protein
MYVTYERYKVPAVSGGESLGDDGHHGMEEALQAAAAQTASGNKDAAAQAIGAAQEGRPVTTARAPDPRLRARFPVRFRILGL